jgi:hypothetical protein
MYFKIDFLFAVQTSQSSATDLLLQILNRFLELFEPITRAWRKLLWYFPDAFMTHAVMTSSEILKENEKIKALEHLSPLKMKNLPQRSF